jgi:hypothetical protein
VHFSFERKGDWNLLAWLLLYWKVIVSVHDFSSDCHISILETLVLVFKCWIRVFRKWTRYFDIFLMGFLIHRSILSILEVLKLDESSPCHFWISAHINSWTILSLVTSGYTCLSLSITILISRKNLVYQPFTNHNRLPHFRLFFLCLYCWDGLYRQSFWGNLGGSVFDSLCLCHGV